MVKYTRWNHVDNTFSLTIHVNYSQPCLKWKQLSIEVFHIIFINVNYIKSILHLESNQESILWIRIKSAHHSHILNMCFCKNSLSHGPRWATAKWGKMLLLLLDLQHEHQTGILVPQVVEKEDHKVVDHISLVALSTCVYVDGNVGIL